MATNTQYDDLTLFTIWSKGQSVNGYNPNIFRKDRYGSWMRRDQYGSTTTQYGWEVDHIYPSAKGGSDWLSNLQPLQWQNNRRKSDKRW
jgi:5-methylcytosine-specific restriction endonuclease McrA